MIRLGLFRHLLCTVLLGLAACSPVATAVLPPTAGPASATPILGRPTATAAMTTTAIGTAAAQDLTPPDQVNPATQARLRLADYVADGPNVDLVINHAIATNTGQPQVNIPANYAAGYLFLPPATYSVAVVPTGQGLDQALAGPQEVTVTAGHRYTLAIMGQIADKSTKALLVDETEAVAKTGAKPGDSVRIWVDNLAGGTGLDISDLGGTITTHVDYGGYAAAVYPVGNHPYSVKVDGVEGAFFPYDQDYNLPATSNLVGFVGTWGQNSDYVAGPANSDLNVIQYLQAFSGQTVDAENYNSFSTLLQAIKSAGLEDLLTQQGPHVFMAPNDNAFKRLPPDQLAALLANPKAMAELLRNHIVPGYVPRGALSVTPGGPFSRTLINLLGNPLAIGEDYTINGLDVGGDSILMADGTQIHPIKLLLLPPTMVTPTPVPATAAASTGPAPQSAASGRLVFQADQEGNNEIYSLNADGSGLTNLTHNPADDSQPFWSPDGSQIIFTSNRDGNYDVFVMHADGSQPTNLTHSPGDDGAAAWSPDGKRVVFVSKRDGGYEIYAMDADGSQVVRLTNNLVDDGDPTWAPDGQQIVFLSRQDGSDDVWVMHADGSHPIDLTHDAVNDGGPAWSPDGQHIAFDTDRNGQYDIYVMNADGSGQTRLTDDPANDYWVTWSPDGKQLAFTSERVGQTLVYVMAADGSGQTALPNGPLGGAWPSWAKP